MGGSRGPSVGAAEGGAAVTAAEGAAWAKRKSKTWQTAWGLGAFAQGVYAVATSPGLLGRCALHAPFVALGALAAAAAVWLVTVPVRFLLPEWTPGWEQLLGGTALVALAVSRALLVHLWDQSFTMALRRHDNVTGAAVATMPIRRGLVRQAAELLACLLAAAAALVALVVAAPVAFPLVAAAVVANAAVVTVAGVVLTIVSVALGWGLYLISPLLTLFSKLKQVDTVLALIVLVGLIVGLVEGRVVDRLIACARMYVATTYAVKQLLAPYEARLHSKEWDQFCAEHKWRMFGFGIPVWLLFGYCPLVGIAALEVLQAASARLPAKLHVAKPA